MTDNNIKNNNNKDVIAKILKTYYQKHFIAESPETDTDCITQDDASAIFSGSLSEKNLEILFKHINQCKRCANLISEFSKLVDDDSLIDKKPSDDLIKKIKSQYADFIRAKPKFVSLSLNEGIINIDKTDGEAILPLKINEESEIPVKWDLQGYAVELRFYIAKDDILNLRIGILENNKYIPNINILLFRKKNKKLDKKGKTAMSAVQFAQIKKDDFLLEFDFKKIEHCINISYHE